MDPTSLILLIFIVILVAAVGVGGGLGIRYAVRRSQIRQAITSYGWQSDRTRSLQRVMPLSLSPFDIGFKRELSEAIVGTSSNGTPFQAFEYSTTEPRTRARVTMVALPHHYPALFVSTDAKGHSRFAVQAEAYDLEPRWAPVLDVATNDQEFARALLTPQLLDELAQWAVAAPAPEQKSTPGIDLAVDGNNLVALRTPSTKEPEELRVFVDHLARVASLFDHDALTPYRRAPKEPRLGFRGTDWTWLGEDQTALGQFGGMGPVGQGQSPRVHDTVRGTHRGLEFVAFQYHWQTTSSNGEHTTTHNHYAAVLSLFLPAPVPSLSLTLGKQKYGLNLSPVLPSGDVVFDRSYDVFSSHPNFAADVVTPTMRQWLMSWRPPVINIVGNRVIAFPHQHTPWDMTKSLDFLCAFVENIDDRVWQTIGVPRPGLEAGRGAEPEGMIGPDGQLDPGTELR
ncbi:hypothetical protein ACQBAR_06155 [Propionibacteriaceae bacterium Y1685]|uniref:hypothetical protein n=1 Tax=Microlunatus sp. Y1700 TaxID=3418487 RepID=UPI003B803895